MVIAASPAHLLLLFLTITPLSCVRFSAAASDVCPRSDLAFLDPVRSQCPPWIERSLPVEVRGDLEGELSHGQRNAYYAVLLHASWCPFSRSTRPTFDALSIMFPQIRHLAVEESSALPSLFSRYGVHSFPSIIIANQTTRVQYQGPKDLSSLVLFYKKITGHDPVADFSVDQSVKLGNEGPIWPWNGSPREILRREPYLAFALLFLCFKAFLYFFPEILSQLKAIWVSYTWCLNFGIFGEWSQLLERALHIIDVKRLWSKFRLCNKTRNFQKGANNARVWASSLTSVSLGESSSSRSAALDS